MADLVLAMTPSVKEPRHACVWSALFCARLKGISQAHPEDVVYPAARKASRSWLLAGRVLDGKSQNVGGRFEFVGNLTPKVEGWVWYSEFAKPSGARYQIHSLRGFCTLEHRLHEGKRG